MLELVELMAVEVFPEAREMRTLEAACSPECASPSELLRLSINKIPGSLVKSAGQADEQDVQGGTKTQCQGCVKAMSHGVTSLV